MAWFECTVGKGGESIPLIVTCTSRFAGKTITCTDGTTTLSDTCPSSSPYTVEFKLPNDGTWTISGTIGSYTYTESIVVSGYTASLTDVTTKSITVYSAANDTITYTDLNGITRTITTNSSGQATATFTIYKNGNTSLTFTSNVAKNPSNLSQKYSKTIAISSSTSSIYVMPNGALYWYGYIKSSLGGLSTSGFTLYGNAVASRTIETNSIYFTQGGTTYVGVASANAISLSGYTKLKSHWNSNGSNIAAGLANTNTVNASTVYAADCKATSSGNKVFSANLVNTNSSYLQIYRGNPSAQYGRCYAVWLE